VTSDLTLMEKIVCNLIFFRNSNADLYYCNYAAVFYLLDAPGTMETLTRY